MLKKCAEYSTQEDEFGYPVDRSQTSYPHYRRNEKVSERDLWKKQGCRK